MLPAASDRNATDSASLVNPWPIQVPTNVGPPPIAASASRKRPRRDAPLPCSVHVAGQRGDDAEALGGVVQGEADDQDGRQRDVVGRGRLTDRQALREVVRADARPR